jgi:hypothetical protein
MENGALNGLDTSIFSLITKTGTLMTDILEYESP